MLTLVLADSKMKVNPNEIDKRRSEPDLVHITLLLAIDSGLSEERELRVIVHTRDDKIFRIESHVEIPENFKEFENMIVDTVQGRGPKGITYSENNLMEILEEEVGHRIVMSPHGEKTPPIDIFSRAEDYVAVIGGFKEGDFVSPVYEWADKKISISDSLMKSWSVAAEVLVAYRYCSLE